MSRVGRGILFAQLVRLLRAGGDMPYEQIARLYEYDRARFFGKELRLNDVDRVLRRKVGLE